MQEKNRKITGLMSLSRHKLVGHSMEVESCSVGSMGKIIEGRG